MDGQENMTDIQNYLDNFQKDLQTNTNDPGKTYHGTMGTAFTVFLLVSKAGDPWLFAYTST